jgi:VWFA-related protein
MTSQSLCLIAASTLWLALAGRAGGQQPAVFRAGVDLLTVETTVLDRAGRPVQDLGPSDFTVTVAGQPRKVLFARFSGSDAARRSAATTTTGAPAVAGHHSVGADAPAGRTVVFFVDRDSIKSGTEKALLEMSATVLDSLTPADASGLLGLPAGGVELTREHGRVRAALKALTGTRPQQGMFLERRISWQEALAYEQNNRRVIDEVVERECPQVKADPSGLVPQCPLQLFAQANQMLQIGRIQVQTTLSLLNRLADRLAPLRGPKHVLMMSGGMPFGQDLLPLFNEFARKAAAAQIVLYAVHLDQPESDAGDRKAVASAFGGRDMASGLSAMTGMTGGAFFNGVGNAAGVFGRIAIEINNYYELGIETRPEDAGGKPRDIDVKVARPGLSVRAPKQVMLPDRATAAAWSADPVKTLLQQATDFPGLPIAVTAYTTRGTEDKTLRVLLSAEIGAAQSRLPADWGFVVIARGDTVASGRQRIEPGAERQTDAAPWPVTTSATLAPGSYRVRFAAAEADGRAGVIDIPLTVGLRAAGDLQVSDLILGTAHGPKLQPRARVAQGVPLSALIELLSADPARLSKSRAALEIIPAGSAEPVKRVLMAARGGGSDAILLNEAQIETGSLAPGRYTASVIVLQDDQPVGRVSRVFDIVAAGK